MHGQQNVKKSYAALQGHSVPRVAVFQYRQEVKQRGT